MSHWPETRSEARKAGVERLWLAFRAKNKSSGYRPIPFKDFLQFCKDHERATELLLDLYKIPDYSAVYKRIQQSADSLDSFKTCVKALEVLIEQGGLRVSPKDAKALLTKLTDSVHQYQETVIEFQVLDFIGGYGKTIPKT